MLFSFDGTLLIQVLNFVAFWILLNYLFIAPARRAIEARLRYIATQYREAETFRAQAKELSAQADSILNNARRALEDMMRYASSRASDEAHHIERKATDEAAATVAMAHATVANERAEAVAEQVPFIEELARTMSERALAGGRPT